MKKTILLLIAGLGAATPAAGQYCNPYIRTSTPTADFVDNGNGTVSHLKTGLLWKKCTEGQYKAPLNRCLGSPASYTWQGALKRAAAVNAQGYAGFTDWRVPNYNELASIVEDKCVSPAINAKLFPDTPSIGFFWSASPYAYSSYGAWLVSFNDGNDGSDVKNYAHAVRLVRGGQSFDSLAAKRVVLLLHGMNSKPETWNDLVRDGKFPDCPVIYAGITAMASPNPQGARCYRVKFGEYDAGGANGLENAKLFGTKNGIALAGDFSTFAQLGKEVKQAVQKIITLYPNAKVTLLGHSRGGLAARAFLQDPAAPTVARDSVAALVTTGTPHAGSRLGMVYYYIKSSLLDASGNRVGEFDGGDNQQDWEVVKFLDGEAGFPLVPKDKRLDVRRPVIAYLAENSPQISAIKNGAVNLPTTAVYGAINYSAVDLGVLGDSWLDYTIFGAEATHVGEQLSGVAEFVLLGDGNPGDYPGDGIVEKASQTDIPNATFLDKADGTIVHTEEPGQTADMMQMFCSLSLSGWLSACPAAPQSGTAPMIAQAPAAVGKPSPEELRLTAELEHRQHEYDAWRQTPAGTLLTQWRKTNRDQDAMRRELLGAALIRRWQQGDGEAVYPQAAQQLRQTSMPLVERAKLVALLGETAMPQALQILLQQLQANGDPALRNAVLSAIGQMGDYRWGGRFHDELSPLLEAAWRDAGNDAGVLTALAQALAKVGAPQGVALLLRAVAQSGRTARDLQENYSALSETDARALAAWQSLDDLRNPDAVPVLAAALQRHTPKDVAFKATGDGLAAMGLAQATEALLQWAEQAPDDAKPDAEHWLGRMRDEASMRVLHARMSDAKPFRSRVMQGTVRGIVDKLEAR